MPLPVNLPEERLQPERQASTVFALDGTPIGVFKGAETQVEVSAENIPDTIRRAVVAAEDHRFFKHRGVDWQAIGRAIQEDIEGRRVRPGRLDHHPAADPEPLHRQRADRGPQGQGGAAGHPGRAGLLQGGDPRPLPQHGVPRRVDLRRRGGQPVVLPQAGQGHHAVRGRSPGRGHPRAQRLLAPGQPGTGRAAPPTHPRPAGPLPDGHARGGGQGPGRGARRPSPAQGGDPAPVVHGLPARLPPEREGLYGATGLRREPADRDDLRPPPAGRRRGAPWPASTSRRTRRRRWWPSSPRPGSCGRSSAGATGTTPR